MGERFAGHHDHFRCSSCGRLLMVRNALPRSLLDGLERKYGFSVKGFDLHLEGMCSKCLEGRA
jgi:Fe2+ or Zn2+ uptake regulation protein